MEVTGTGCQRDGGAQPQDCQGQPGGALSTDGAVGIQLGHFSILTIPTEKISNKKQVETDSNQQLKA